MNLLEAMDILGITQEEYEKMNIIKLTRAYTKARQETPEEDYGEMNQAYMMLLDTKKNRIRFKSKPEEKKSDYSRIGITENIYPVVARDLNNYKAVIPYNSNMKQLVLPLNIIFEEVSDKEFIITPNWVKQGVTIFGYMEDAKVPYEITIK